MIMKRSVILLLAACAVLSLAALGGCGRKEPTLQEIVISDVTPGNEAANAVIGPDNVSFADAPPEQDGVSLEGGEFVVIENDPNAHSVTTTTTAQSTTSTAALTTRTSQVTLTTTSAPTLTTAQPTASASTTAPADSAETHAPIWRLPRK